MDFSFNNCFAPMIRSICSFTAIMTLLGCQQPEIVTIDADRLISLQDQGVVVVDVRTQNEYQAGHVPDVTLNFDFLGQDFMQQMESLDKSQPVIIYCAKGGRSGKAAALLQGNGFQKVYDYAGGFNDWKSAGKAVEK